MLVQTVRNALLALTLVEISQALPGLRDFVPRNCPQDWSGGHSGPCTEISSTTIAPDTTISTGSGANTITQSPVLIAQAYRRNVDDKTASCSGDKCYVWDVSSSLVTVITLADATSSPRPPYTNASDTTGPHNTGTAPGTGHVSATTGRGFTHGRNATTTITSRTVPIVSMTASGWSPWKPTSNASAAATSDQPLHSTNATGSGFRPGMPLSWSIWQPMPTRGPTGSSSMRLNSTFVSDGQTSTTEMPSPTGTSCSSNATDCTIQTISASFVTTRTFIFADTTIVIPIPAGYASTMKPEATTNSLSSSSSTYATSGRISSSLSTSSCWTTTAPSMSDNSTMTAQSVSRICWLLECDDNNSCTDHISRYPMTVDSESTSMVTPSANSTATRPAGTSSNPDFATATSSTDHHSVWAPWPTQRNGSTIDTTSTPSPLTSPSPESSDTSIDGTITRTVIPLPGSTPEADIHAKGAMLNRKRFIEGRSHFKAVQEEQDKRDQ